MQSSVTYCSLKSLVLQVPSWYEALVSTCPVSLAYRRCLVADGPLELGGGCCCLVLAAVSCSPEHGNVPGCAELLLVTGLGSSEFPICSVLGKSLLVIHKLNIPALEHGLNKCRPVSTCVLVVVQQGHADTRSRCWMLPGGLRVPKHVCFWMQGFTCVCTCGPQCCSGWSGFDPFCADAFSRGHMAYRGWRAQTCLCLCM